MHGDGLDICVHDGMYSANDNSQVYGYEYVVRTPTHEVGHNLGGM